MLGILEGYNMCPAALHDLGVEGSSNFNIRPRSPLVTSSDKLSHISSDLAALEFALTDEEMEQLGKVR